MQPPEFAHVYGVDFSGAKKAGENTWIARLEPVARRRRRGSPAFVLASLDRLEALAGTTDRGPALAHLVGMVLDSHAALWGFDFPFGLPVELFPAPGGWPAQFAFLAEWGEAAYDCGLECVRRTKELYGRLHLRRTTDGEGKAPFDAFHYRIIYQTFYGMRDVVGPLRLAPRTAVLPFQYRKLRTASRVVVECCPGSVLKLAGQPHQNYKQPAGGPLTPKRRAVRRALLDWLGRHVVVSDRHRRVMMRNPGGDALDAAIAALGTARAVASVDHRAIARHARYPHEGRLYVDFGLDT